MQRELLLVLNVWIYLLYLAVGFYEAEQTSGLRSSLCACWWCREQIHSERCSLFKHVFTLYLNLFSAYLPSIQHICTFMSYYRSYQREGGLARGRH